MRDQNKRSQLIVSSVFAVLLLIALVYYAQRNREIAHEVAIRAMARE